MGIKWDGRMEDYPLEIIRLRPGKPPNSRNCIASGTWKRWNASGERNGRIPGDRELREVALIDPMKWRVVLMGERFNFLYDEVWEAGPGSFIKQHNEYAKILEANGVKIHWMTIDNPWGAYVL